LIPQARKIIQIGLNPVRCGDCNALLCTASTGSVISIVCGRCKTHNIIEVEKKLETPKQNPQQ